MDSFLPKIRKLSAEKPIFWSVLVFVIAAVLVGLLSLLFYGTEFYEKYLLKAQGMLLELLILGAFVYWLNWLGERQRTIKRYLEEIKDYSEWLEPDATYRIVGNIKRLNREGVTQINLEGACLKGAFLWEANLAGANLKGTNLEGALLVKANLRGAILENANLKEASLSKADLTGASLWEAELCDAFLGKANLTEANLRGANLLGTDLLQADLAATELAGAIYNSETNWPKGFNPRITRAVLVENRVTK